MELLKINLNLTDHFHKTIDWNRVANGGRFAFTDGMKDLQHACLREEVEELKDAIEANNPIEVVDAICDILFVSCFAWYMRSGGQVNVGCLANDIGVVSQDYTLQDLYEEVQAALNSYDYRKICSLIISNSLLFDFNLRGAYEEVVSSNFSKFPLVEDINVEEELIWFREHSKYEHVIASYVKNRVVFRSHYGGGKVVKPRCFKEPELIWHLNEVSMSKIVLDFIEDDFQ